MKTIGTYFQNDAARPLVYGEVELIDPPRRRLRGEPEKRGVLCETVIAGFCGTDHTLMEMGRRGELTPKFPAGQRRLINGHEGVVWVPEENRFAIVLIRGGDSWDPTRYTEDETYFEYGCDQADGLFADQGYFHPDMLLPIPDDLVKDGKLPLSFAKKMVFPDPFACMLFQLERMEDLGSAHNFRVELARGAADEQAARDLARVRLFDRVVIFGLGTTGMFLGDLIHRSYPDARIVFVGRSDEGSDKVRFAREMTSAAYVQSQHDSEASLARDIEAALGGKATAFVGASGAAVESRIAFEQGVLGCNGIYNSFSLGPKLTFDTMPFGFQNHLIFSSINFRQSHMEQAIRMLADSRYDEIVALIDREVLARDPIAAYENLIYSKAAPLKTAVLWNPDLIDRTR